TNAIDGAPGGAVVVAGGNEDLAIQCNTLADNERGLWVVQDTGFAANRGVVARFNNFEGNTRAGVEVASKSHSGKLAAIRNWWGDASGPSGIARGHGDKALGDVAYQPWSR